MKPRKFRLDPPTRKQVESFRHLLHSSSPKPDGLEMLDRTIEQLERLVAVDHLARNNG